jgi:hypothetical protein
MVVGSSFAINLPIWGLTDAGAQPGGDITGGLAAHYIAMLVVYVQLVTQLLPFAMGVGLSRRSFYLGTAVMALAQSVGYGVVLTVLDAVEDATDGWSVGLHFWAPGRLDVGNPSCRFSASPHPCCSARPSVSGSGSSTSAGGRRACTP